MITIHRDIVTTSTADAVTSHLNNVVAPTLQADVSNYAKGRRRTWLQHEAPLSKYQPFRDGLRDSKLWEWCTAVAKRAGMTAPPELGLAIYGDTGISLHRDASYAAPQAVSINLGGVLFQYDRDRNGNGSATVGDYTLDKGEVMLFDCKHRHAAIEPARDRWCIVLWSISHKVRPKYDKYLSSGIWV